MNDSELVNYLTECRKNESLARNLQFWFETCSVFKNFIILNKEKVRKKITGGKTDEDLKDIQSELLIPYLLLLDNRFEVEYEKYGMGKTRAPDFFVTFEKSASFNVEVKKIRKTPLDVEFNQCFREIGERIRTVPSDLLCRMDVISLNPDCDLIARLKISQEKIVCFAQNTIYSEKDKLSLEDSREYPVPGFEDEVTLILDKSSSKINLDHTYYYHGLKPLFFTQREFYKFRDTIFEKMGQMLPGMVNILVITSDSDTHDQHDLLEAIKSINQRLARSEESFFIKKGFKGSLDFREQSKIISAILFRNNWVSEERDRNFLWYNKIARNPLLEAIGDYLETMDIFQNG